MFFGLGRNVPIETTEPFRHVLPLTRGDCMLFPYAPKGIGLGIWHVEHSIRREINIQEF